MPKKDGDDVVISEIGNWNVADKYSKYKIMKPLILADFYEDIARFGYESIVEELNNYQAPPNDLIKIKAVKRLIQTLIRLIDNAKFACRKSGTTKTIVEYQTKLLKLESEVLPKLVEVGGNKIVIKDLLLYEKFLEQLRKIKSKINEPLNRNDLIFTNKDEFDPIEFKNRMKERMRNKG